MAKAYVLKALQGVLSDYLEIDEHNFDLNLAVWSGSIVLHDVKLRNDSIFRNLNLTSVYGSVKKLEVFIPWTALMSSPVRIEIDGVYLLLKPLDVITLNKKEARKRGMAAKQEKIAFADKFLTYHSQHELLDEGDIDDANPGNNKKKKEGWVEAWTTKIVDNLEISLKNIHIRYEDSECIPGKTFSAGVTLGSFILATCDENWKPSFVARKNEAIRKLCSVENSGMYWNMQSASLASLNFKDWQQAMQAIIYNPPHIPMPDAKDKSAKAIQQRADAAAAAAKAAVFVDNQSGPGVPTHSPEAMKFVLLPTNKLVVKVVHNDHLAVPGEMPKYDITVVNEKLDLCVDSLQLKQLNASLDKMNAVERSKKPYMYKPSRRPVDKESIRSWWKYACKLVIKRPRYIRLVKRSKSQSATDHWSAQDAQEMEALEEQLSLQTIIIFRHMAAEEMAHEAKLAREDLAKARLASSKSGKAASTGAQKPVRKERTWWGFFSGEPAPDNDIDDDSGYVSAEDKPDDLQEDLSISSIIGELEEYKRSQQAKDKTHSLYMRLSLESSATLQLAAYGVPVLHASMTLKALSKTVATGTRLDLDLTELQAVDLITPTPMLPHLISVKQLTDSSADTATKGDESVSVANKPNFTVSFDSTGERKVLRITSLPLVLACNKICIQYILEILSFSSPNVEGKLTANELIKDNRPRMHARDALLKATSGTNSADIEAMRRKKSRLGEVGDAFEIIFEAHAPKIIIPEDSSSDKGYLLLDTGYLRVRGFTGEAGMSWDVALSDVNAGMPLHVNDMYKLSQRGNEALYLIKPFDIDMTVQNVDRSLADMTVDIDIKPEIRGELSAQKLERLLDVFLVATTTFTSRPEDLPGMATLKALAVHARQAPTEDLNALLASGVRHATASIPGLSPAPLAENVSKPDAEENVADSDIQSLLNTLRLQEDGLDSARVGLALVMRVPVVALDLMYDEEKGFMQIFEIRSMVARLINRPHDLSIDFSMGELSIQDSMRSASQRYLACTPRVTEQTSKQHDLINVSYISCETNRSPYFKEHGAMAVVDFANLTLTFDVNTLMHLRPFINVVLHREKAPPVAAIQAADMNGSALGTSAHYQSVKPDHMHLTLSMRNLTLDILRVSPSADEGVALDRAFSLRWLGLKADMDMKELMTALVTVRSVEVLDIREISRDYVIKKVFGPMTMQRDSKDSASGSIYPGVQTSQTLYESGSVAVDKNLVCIDFRQESKHVSHMDVLVSDACTFGSTDTFLDMSNVVLDNFLAMLALLEKPATSALPQNNVDCDSAARISVQDADDSIEGEDSIFRDSAGISANSPQQSATSLKLASANHPDRTQISATGVREFRGREELHPAAFEKATMVLTAKIDNPCMILLDDPTKEDSQAIVARCGCDVDFTRETITELATGRRAWKESVHTTVKNLEVYVLKDVRRYFPKAILLPLAMEFNMKREAYCGAVLSSNISVDTGGAHCRVTLNDVILARSILMRKATMDREDADSRRRADSIDMPTSFSTSDTSLQDNQSDDMSSDVSKEVEVPSATAFNFVLNIGQISLVVINDFNAQDMPVARMQLDDASLALSKKGAYMEGDGTLFISASSYNNLLGMWEPLLDRWHPALVIETSKNGNVFNIKSAHTMQITVSGAMLKTFLETSAFLQQGRYGDIEEEERIIVPEILVQNELGSSIEISLRDSVTGQLLMSLPPGQALPMQKIMDVTSDNKRLNSALQLPTSVNMHFSGSFGEQRAPVTNIPVSAVKTRLYHLLPLPSAKSPNKRSAVGDTQSLEGRTEETFENSRLDEQGQTWRKPFLRGDPPEWSDVSGTVRCDVQQVALPPDGMWEWHGRWMVAPPNGSPSERFEEDGWEYATSFSALTTTGAHRAFQPSDTVRRRRWVRTRVLKGDISTDKLRAMVLHWDVHPLPNSARKIIVRSGMQIVNNMPFAMSVVLSYPGWESSVELGPIEEAGTLYVPLLASCATSISMRPAHVPYAWSSSAPCAIEVADYSRTVDVQCKGEALAPICMRASFIQCNKSLTIAFEPYLVVHNFMPCDLRFKVFGTNGKNQEDSILCGALCKIAYVNLADNPQIKLCTPKTLLWSGSVAIPILGSKGDEPLRIELPNSQGHGADFKDNGLVICLHTEVENNSLKVLIYPKYVLIDRTGLGLSISTYKAPQGEEMLRHTYSIGSKAPTAASLKKAKEVAAAKARASREALKNASPLAKVGDVLAVGRMSSAESMSDAEAVGSGSDADGNKHSAEIWHDSSAGPISDLHVDSSNTYLLVRSNHADLVYTDRQFLWSHLPETLRGQYCLRLACNDKLRQARSFIQFRVEQASYVVLLVDMRTRGALKWPKEDGFKEMLGHAVARRIHHGQLDELCFIAYGKFFDTGAIVTLRGNFCTELTSMYAVFIVPAPAEHEVLSLTDDAFFSQFSFHQSYNRDAANSSWQDGGDGVCVFYSGNDNMSVGVRNGQAWSEEFSISMSNVTHAESFEVVDWTTNEAFQLAYNMRLLPGNFSHTQEVVIVPRFCVVNLLDEELMVVQRGCKDVRTYHPYRADAWHKSNVNLGTCVQFRCRSSFWSLGTVDISEIGTSSLHLPRKDDSTAGSDAIVLHVEVKIAAPGEHCSVVILVWRATVESSTDLCIQNETDCPVTVMQAGIQLDKELSARRLFQLCVAPFCAAPFGWADPDLQASVYVVVGTEIQAAGTGTVSRDGRSKQRLAEISLLKAGEHLRLPDNSGRQGLAGEVVLSVVAQNGGRVLRVSRWGGGKRSGITPEKARRVNAYAGQPGTLVGSEPIKRQEELGYEMNFYLASFGISLVLEKPVRRELLSLYVDGLSVQQLVTAEFQSTEVKVQNMQVDNYCEECLFPVLFHDNRHNDKESSDDAPLILLSWVRQMTVGDNHMPIYKYGMMRVLPVTIELDSSTIQFLFTDLINDLKFVTKEQAMASRLPSVWVDERNRYLLSAERLQLLDVYSSKTQSQHDKLYLEHLLIHPMSITLTFVQTPFPRKSAKNATLGSTFMNVVGSLAGVDKMELRLNSFKVSDALESQESLRSAFMYKTWQDIKGQLMGAIGSMSAIGAPLGFAKKIGGGVSDLFYEPFKGGVLSPRSFFSGLQTGANSLAVNFVSGAATSLGGISGTASRGLGYLAGDNDYVRQRALKRHQSKVQNNGFLDGVLDGAESFVSGVGSGLSGLVARPLEGAAAGGLGGFFRGVGLGLLGAVVKPAIGLADGVSAVATGVGAHVNSDVTFSHVRPARALERSAADTSDLVIGAMSVKAAYAQDFVVRRAKTQQYEDTFLSYTPLSDTTEEAVILSETYIFWRKERSLWGRTWANVSHCLFFGDSVGIFLYSAGNNAESGREIVMIPCPSRDQAIALYGNLARHALRMGNPCNVVPLASVVRPEWLSDPAFRDAILRARGLGPTLDNFLDGYRFGTANEPFRRTTNLDESQLEQAFQQSMQRPFASWGELDRRIWAMIEAWDQSHRGLRAARCCAFLIINRSDSAVTLTRLEMLHGHLLMLLGSAMSGYDAASRTVLSQGVVLLFATAYVPTPIEVGHLKVSLECPAFQATVASTQRDSLCDMRGMFQVGFVEKAVAEWWSKYVLVIS